MIDQHQDTIPSPPAHQQEQPDSSEVRAAQLTLDALSASTGKSVSEILANLRRLASRE